MTALPGQDATLAAPQQAYVAGQQPMYQQVRPGTRARPEGASGGD